MTTSFLRSFLLLSLSGFIGWGAIAPASYAQNIVDIKTNTTKDESSDSRYGVPGRRIGGGTRILVFVDALN